MGFLCMPRVKQLPCFHPSFLTSQKKMALWWRNERGSQQPGQRDEPFSTAISAETHCCSVPCAASWMLG